MNTNDRVAFQHAAATAMFKKSEEMNVQGTATTLIMDVAESNPSKFIDPTHMICGRFQRGPDPEKKGDPGTNYLAVSFSKAAESIDTKKASGTTKGRIPKKGESGSRGSVISRVGNFELATSFSGGTEDQDVLIAQAGMNWLLNLIDDYTKSK